MGIHQMPDLFAQLLLVIFRMDFTEWKESVLIGTIINKSSLKTRLYRDYSRLVDIVFRLGSGYC